MTRITRMLAATFVVAMAVSLGAQEAATAQSKEPPAKPALVPLKVQIVLSRYQGEKKISSVPYTLSVTANDQRSTSLRMGTQMPIPSTVINSAGNSVQQSYSYKDVGTNIDAGATSATDNYFRLNVTVTDSSVYFPDKNEQAAGAPPATMGATPAFRNFTTNFIVLLRDGQSGQQVAATDPISGQVVRIDVTVNVLK